MLTKTLQLFVIILTLSQLPSPMPNLTKRQVVIPNAPESHIPIKDSNLIIYSEPNVRIDIYEIRRKYRNPQAKVDDTYWPLYSRYIDIYTQLVVYNKRTDKDGIFEVKLPPGEYAVGACDLKHRLGHTDIFTLFETPQIQEIKLHKWNNNNE